MRYVHEFRDAALAARVAGAIARAARPGREYRLMEFCGGHTHAIARHGVTDRLPDNVRLVHGPGCPVCVLPVARLEAAIALASMPGVTLCSFGDMLRVPGAKGRSLLSARAQGADVRMVYSVDDALAIARREPGREVVFFAIGFETTTPPTAVALDIAEREGLANFSVYCNHVLTPPAIEAILSAPARDGPRIDGVIGPAHVSTVIGTRPYEPVTARHGCPMVITGFEPLDVLQAVLMLIRQIETGRASVENEFTRVVSADGNVVAQRLMAQAFVVRERFEWRGLGTLPDSALAIAPRHAARDAERRFVLQHPDVPDHKACACADVLRGRIEPAACPVFGTACTPATPLGACMVSSEGACAAHHAYGRRRREAAGA